MKKNQKIRTDIFPLIFFMLYALSCTLFYRVFAVQWSPALYGVTLVIIFGQMFGVIFNAPKMLAMNRKKCLGFSLLFAAVWFVLGLLLPVVLLNNVLRIGEYNVCLCVLCVNLTVFTVLSLRFSRKAGIKPGIRALFGILSIILAFLPMIRYSLIPSYYQNYSKKAAAPVNLGTYTQKEQALVKNADFYVSVTGSDENNGTLSAPFATLERAKKAVRELDKTGKNGVTVAVLAGEYRVDQLSFSKQDSGTGECPVVYCAYGDGEVILNGGVTLKPEDFHPVSDEAVLSRFSEEARKAVVCADLKKYGLTQKDWGKLYALGSYHTAAKYDGDYVGGMYCELFFNDTRMKLARYPDEGWLTTDKIIETGYGRESDGALTANANWDEVRNPKGDTYRLDKKLAQRVASWQTLDDVWMFGFFKYTWADASTLIESFDPQTGDLTTKFVSCYGTEKTAPYYFYNVLEELNSKGEWYLDRENGYLYIIPPEDISNAVIDFSVTDKPLIDARDTDYLTLKGFTVKGTRSDAISVTGSHNTVTGCLIKNVGGYALLMNGSLNTANENEITHTGKGGIVLDGGDRETLTPGENKADNNLIHDWSEVYLTYQPAVTLNGVGNICSHNEIYNSPHEAITYSGNDHVIEYNNIHHVCLLSDDAGAIYSGRRWDWYGTVIRYNSIADIYSDGHKACGIYMDDALSGQTIYGNFLVNVGSIGIHLGGGRDLTVKNNVLVNCNDRAFSYDDRARDGVVNNGWFKHSSKKDGDMWTNLYSSPWKTSVWQKAYPQYEHFSDDFNNTDSPDFFPNPAYSEVCDNLVINIKKTIGDISDSADRFSTVENNAVYRTGAEEDIFTDPQNGDYTFKAGSEFAEKYPQLQSIPFEQIGRY